MNKKIIKYLQKIENPYIVKVGEMKAELSYSENGKNFKDCMLNILKQKKKMG